MAKAYVGIYFVRGTYAEEVNTVDIGANSVRIDDRLSNLMF